MKAFAKGLIVVTLTIGIIGGYMMFGPHLRVWVEETSVTPATERAEEFRLIMTGVRDGHYGIHQYHKPGSASAEDYEFVTVAFTARNNNLLTAEWTQVNMAPASNDVVLVQADPVDVRAFQTARITASILTKKGAPQAERQLWVDYYIYGDKESALPVERQ